MIDIKSTFSLPRLPTPVECFYKQIETRCSSWCDGSSDRSFMVDPLSYFSFQPVIHDWCNKGCGMCYPVCVMVHIKEPFLQVENSSPEYSLFNEALNTSSFFFFFFFFWRTLLTYLPLFFLFRLKQYHQILVGSVLPLYSLKKEVFFIIIFHSG